MGERGQQGQRFDVVVIGGGVAGAAVTLEVTRRGARVALLEAGALAIARGSSAGAARIFSPAAFPDSSYLERALRGLERWRAIEAEGREPLLRRTGVVSLGEFAERQLPALRDAGVEVERLSHAEAEARFGLRLPASAPLVYQPDAGVIRADRARATLLRLARAAGAELRGDERVRSIAERGDSVELVTDRRRWQCSAAVLAAGPWNAELLAGLGLGPALAITAQTVAYFACSDPPRPVVIEYEDDEPYACWDPQRGLKAALHARGAPVRPGDGDPAVDSATIERLVEWVGARFPGLEPAPVAVETCRYTWTPDERFAIEPEGRIVVVSACNGQGFQFAPETGERAAELAIRSAALAPVGD